MMELERQRRPVLIVAHRAVLRCLYAYLTDMSLDQLPYSPIPLHAVLKVSRALDKRPARRLLSLLHQIEPNAYGVPVEITQLMDDTA